MFDFLDVVVNDIFHFLDVVLIHLIDVIDFRDGVIHLIDLIDFLDGVIRLIDIIDLLDVVLFHLVDCLGHLDKGRDNGIAACHLWVWSNKQQRRVLLNGCVCRR